MDQKTFLAIVLSLGIFVIYNKVFVEPKIAELKQKNAQISVNKEDADIPSLDAPPLPASSAVKSPKKIVNEISYEITNGELIVDLSNQGAAIKKITLKKHAHTLPVTHLANAVEFQNDIFEKKSLANNRVEFFLQKGDLEITKTITLTQAFEIESNLKIYNKSTATKEVTINVQPVNIDMSSVDKKHSATEAPYLEYSVLTDKKMNRKGHAASFSEKDNKEYIDSIKWVGYRDRFFAVVVKNEFKTSPLKLHSTSKDGLTFQYATNIQVPAGKSAQAVTSIYYGPQHLDLMKQYQKEYDRILAFSNFNIIDFFAFSIYKSTHFLQKFLKNWGISIILVSFILFGLTYPLTLMSMKSMKKLQAIQPEINAIKEKYKGKTEKINLEMAELIRKSGANPLAGCLPMLLQIPIFFAVFQVFWRTYSFKGQDFLWIKDLSLPDHLFKFPFEIPIVGSYFNILPIVYAIAIYLQQKFSSKNMVFTNPEDALRQKMMTTMMPIVLVFAFYNFSSSITLYFTVFYSLQTFVQWKMSKVKS